VIITGDIQGKIMTEVQPMKMAAAEALYNTPADGQTSAPFSVLTIGDVSGENATPVIEIPGLLSFLATGSFNGKVVGINELEKQYEQEYGSGAATSAGIPTSMTTTDSYKPNIPITYWTFRLMMGFGFLAMVVGAWILYVTRKGRVPALKGFSGKLLLWSAITLPLMPLVANSFGWIFTEMGRQPWIVFGAMTTANGISVSSATGAGSVIVTVVGFTLLYGVLAIVEVGLMLKYIKKGLPDADPPKDDPSDNDSTAPLAFAY
jgi:cytochrome bd ubiquinol oxidase subunit I